MSKDYKCEVCRHAAPRLHMRDQDGKWVCASCLPDKELDNCPGLRERLGLKDARPSRRRAA
ncbi:MAG TPA: hypothetical protein VM870_03215 [Pyrinomonadaceae bacterium]|nr:hypothetical protein [Pyrinomonadaceae bacterium]